jgi:ribulose-phosphate 3-epimerase
MPKLFKAANIATYKGVEKFCFDRAYAKKALKTYLYIMRNPIIAPSVLSADFANLQASFSLFANSPAEWVHIDIMDGRFVPNISFGLPVVQAMRSLTDKYFDVHLMIVEPEKYIEAFHKAGAEQISVHIEACPHLHRTIQQIHDLGMKAGVAVNPHTPVHLLEDIMADIDLVCLMSVNPGFGGQKFIHHTLKKIRDVVQLRTATGSKALIEIDGGVTADNAAGIFEAGADVLVAGSAVFNAANPVATVQLLKNITR